MSRPITLVSETSVIIGNVLLAEDHPLTPPLLALDGTIYLAASVAYGPGSPGAYSVYRAQPAPLSVPPDAVSGPFEEPTKVIGESP